ncbi:leucyl/phenylalanyl-tRNA--protein transferase [Xylophilus sp. Kf1]|nr:leucyl/phenylalanyl-tRNA--protein transferase [Xylophilus sp. Kf1]
MTAALHWLEADDAFPDPALAWGPADPAPGLLAAGGALGVDNLLRAYGSAIFPWFSEGQPILWWSPDPRMVLRTEDFRLHRSLRKTLQRFIGTPGCEVHIDRDFPAVIAACSGAARAGQDGTWILPAMVDAYTRLHAAGHAHSVETWIDGELAGGLYCVAIGGAVFGESMFARRTDASKIALAALVAFCRHHRIAAIDCQQNTRHLASMGAAETSRAAFVREVRRTAAAPSPNWKYLPVYWQTLLSRPPSA